MLEDGRCCNCRARRRSRGLFAVALRNKRIGWQTSTVATRTYSITDVKTLFAHSRNVCAMPGCEERLTDPAWAGVNAEIAHIRGLNPGSPRYEPDMTDAERNGYDNLLLLCANHHKLIDKLEPDAYPAADLQRIKADHEDRSKDAAQWWRDDNELLRVARLLLSSEMRSVQDAGLEGVVQVPRLVLRQEGDDLSIVNVGSSAALKVRVTPFQSSYNVVLMAGAPPERLAPDAVWRFGKFTPSFGDVGPHGVNLSWTDDSGQEFTEEFPVS